MKAGGWNIQTGSFEGCLTGPACSWDHAALHNGAQLRRLGGKMMDLK
jgi:hypothetical protein